MNEMKEYTDFSYHSVFPAENLSAERIRIDVFVCDVMEEFRRSQIQARNAVFVCAGRAVKPGKRIQTGDTIEVFYNDLPETAVEPEPVDYQVLYEDEQTIVVNKPQSLVVHPGAGNYHNTLIQGILYDKSELQKNFGDEKIRPGIVHRLDKDTSGVMIVAKTSEALFFLTRQFAERRVDKIYIAVAAGEMRQHAGGVIETYIGRDPAHRQRFRNFSKPGDHVKYAKTEYTVLTVYNGATLVRLKLHTGRTHQIRLHMQHLGFPVVGDPIYGKKETRKNEAVPEGLLLHALSLALVLPGKKAKQQFTAPMPERFRTFLKRHAPQSRHS